MASLDAVVFFGANLFVIYIFLRMPGRKDARTSEKPLSILIYYPFLDRLLKTTGPIKPEPKRSMVISSGTD